jgi:hypothetical protein
MCFPHGAKASEQYTPPAGVTTTTSEDVALTAIPDVEPSALSPQRVWRQFEKLLIGGAKLKPLGTAKRDPGSLLDQGYRPRHLVELFDVAYYLTNLRSDDTLGFLVGYVHLPRARALHPRIFYKDLSLVWRSASHLIWSDHDQWIGKGDLKIEIRDGAEWEHSAEETTNLPTEIQCALDVISRRVKQPRHDEHAVERILRLAPPRRMEPYADFTGPRRRAAANPAKRINDGHDIATFTRRHDPTSLKFVPGYEPDFADGSYSTHYTKSHFYGGEIRKTRVVSKNRLVQYQFIDGPGQAWIMPPQTLTADIMSYGVRTIDVHAPEELFVPGFEYHFMDDTVDPPELVSQIPPSFAGAPNVHDDARADASRWLDALPVIREYRRHFPR